MWGLIRNSIVKELGGARTAMAALGCCSLDATPDPCAVIGRVKAGNTVTVGELLELCGGVTVQAASHSVSNELPREHGEGD